MSCSQNWDGSDRQHKDIMPPATVSDEDERDTCEEERKGRVMNQQGQIASDELNKKLIKRD